ncbi:MAG: zf-HC2 domain-containing protein [Ktedonobacterales bacterium]|nr:zf-HC2 domain-containing protein [Ktedonobacterales bacterium]
MRCSQATERLQVYIDGRLDARQLAPLERHLQSCSRCRQHLVSFEVIRSALATREEAVIEPPDLAPVIMRRIAALEAPRAAALAPAATPGWRERTWQMVALVAALALAVLLLPPGAQSNLTETVNRGLPGLLQALTAPGPDSVAWAAWAVGAFVVLLLAFRFARAEASASLRRSIAQRLPQLW